MNKIKVKELYTRVHPVCINNDIEGWFHYGLALSGSSYINSQFLM